VIVRSLTAIYPRPAQPGKAPTIPIPTRYPALDWLRPFLSGLSLFVIPA